jgi:subtilisin family serine protease
MSLGAPAVSSYQNDPLCRAARALVDAGIVVVAAAGNNGKDANGNKIYGQIHSPGNEPSVITVGAANTFGTDARDDDGVATYSSRGPTRSYYTDANGIKHYDNIVKPEIVAPGNKLIFAESDSGGSYGLLGFGGSASDYNLLVQQHPELDSGLTDDNNKRLMYLSGTSMATPVVAGAAALLLQTKPQLTPNMVKALLLYTAQPLAGFNMLEQGAGELNVEGAVRVAKLVRTDLSNSTPTGSPFLTTSSVPTPQTTVAGQTFTWSRGLIMNHSYLVGTNLIMKYQPIYGLGVVMGDGDVAGDGIMVSDGIMVGDGVTMGDGIMVSDGVIMGDGQFFLAVSLLMGDGIMVADGIMVGDGVVVGDGIMVGDGVVMGDTAVQAMAARALINGDASTCMH